MKRSTLKNKMYFTLAVCLGLAILLFAVFKSNFGDTYFVKPYGVTKYTNRFNDVGIKNDLNIIVPITIGNLRYNIPAPYLGLVGAWDPKSGSFYSPFKMYIKGTDFSPNKDEPAISPNKPLFLWIESKQMMAQQTSGKPKSVVLIKPPKTITEFDALINNEPSYFGVWYGKLVRVPDLDKFGLIVYRNSSIEIYAGQSSFGEIRSFSCMQKLTWVNVPLCEVKGASKLDEDIYMKYSYAKQYLADWDRFNAGISKLFSSFKHN
jgi:hypothetical protein